MKRAAFLVLLSILIVGSFALAQSKPWPADRVAQGSVPAVQGPVTTSAGYTPILLATGGGMGRGIGVTGMATRVFFDDLRTLVNVYENGAFTSSGVGDNAYCGRWANGYFFGDVSGHVYCLINGKAKLLATVRNEPLISALTVDPANGNVYFATGNGLNVIYLLRKGGSRPVRIGKVSFPCYGLAVKGSGLYFSDFNDGLIYRMPKHGGAKRVVYSGFSSPCDIIFDKGGNLFVADWTGSAIWVLKSGTNVPVPLAEGINCPYGIGLDSKGNVYFSTDAGALWELEKISD